jgi:septum formation protein
VRHPGAIVIGSDQVAFIEGSILGKPGSFDRAKAQLRSSSGRTVQFYTAVAMVCLDRGLERLHVEPFTVRMRILSDIQITNYLHRERPYDCAGSFKIEGLGLIKLTELLNEMGLDILQS